MQLPSRTFAQFVQDMSAVVQGATGSLFNFSPGSVLRALLEANGSVALWMQWLILNVLKTTRAATSDGSDLDSWMADFSLRRLPASQAYGVLTFSRYVSDATTAVIPAGTAVKTADGTTSFLVTGDLNNANWSTEASAYLIPPGAAAISVPALAQNPGVLGNVSPHTIALIASAVPGVDTVTNSGAFIGGVEAESDDSFRKRFQNYMTTRSRATAASVKYVVTALQQNIDCLITENVDLHGNLCPGSFTVTVDDGSGSHSPSLIASITSVIETYRPLGCRFFVCGPATVQVAVSLTANIGEFSPVDELRELTEAAIRDYISHLKIGETLSSTRMAGAVYKTDDRIRYLSNIVFNGGSTDITPPANGIIRPDRITVS